MAAILVDDPLRRTLFPIKYPQLWEMYRTAVSCFWALDEIDLTQDLTDWHERLTNDERWFIGHVLSFFAPSDMIVMDNLAAQFMQEVKVPEARHFYAFQMGMEAEHSAVYSMFIDSLIKDQVEKERLFDGVRRSSSIKMKTEWANKWINNHNPFEERIIAFAIVEGIFFSSSFCAIFWLKKRGLMPGLIFSNILISRDEGMHYDFALLLYRMLDHKISEQRFREILTEAVTIEKEFIREGLVVPLLGMNSSMMEEYAEYVADRLTTSLGFKRIYPGASNPFDWMIGIGMNGKTNFFEKREANYSRPPPRDTLLLVDDY